MFFTAQLGSVFHATSATRVIRREQPSILILEYSKLFCTLEISAFHDRINA